MLTPQHASKREVVLAFIKRSLGQRIAPARQLRSLEPDQGHIAFEAGANLSLLVYILRSPFWGGCFDVLDSSLSPGLARS